MDVAEKRPQGQLPIGATGGAHSTHTGLIAPASAPPAEATDGAKWERHWQIVRARSGGRVFAKRHRSLRAEFTRPEHLCPRRGQERTAPAVAIKASHQIAATSLRKPLKIVFQRVRVSGGGNRKRSGPLADTFQRLARCVRRAGQFTATRTRAHSSPRN